MAALASATRVAALCKPQAAAGSRRHLVVAQAQPEQCCSAPEQGRRSLLAAGLALVATAATARPSAASSGRWDGVSSAIGSCKLGEEGDACRQAILEKDRAGLASYEATANAEAGKIGTAMTGVPVAEMDQEYVTTTLVLMDKLAAYTSFADPVDPARLQVIKELKVEMPKWVSKYARGGSARKTSARKLYVVVDAISAHFASNGLAPLPKAKLAKLAGDVEAAREALALGK